MAIAISIFVTKTTTATRGFLSHPEKFPPPAANGKVVERSAPTKAKQFAFAKVPIATEALVAYEFRSLGNRYQASLVAFPKRE